MRGWVLVAVCIATVVASLAAALALSDRAAQYPGVEPAYFWLAREPSEVSRAQRAFDVMIAADSCKGSRRESPASRFERFKVRLDDLAYVVTAQMRPETGYGDACAGIGLPPFARRLTLPAHLGSRALVTNGGRGNWLRILVPPLGREAIRALVERPGFAYVGRACDDVARYLRDRRKQDWCFY